MLVRVFVLLSLLLLLAAPSGAQDAVRPSGEDRAAIREVIEKQLEAFQRDDGEAAFGYASPTIRGMFGNADIFMDMVRQGYQPVYRPKRVEFGELTEVAGQIAQEVHVIAPDGRPVTAMYVMTRLPDGSWRVDGCYLLAPTRHQA
jgi:hypothetical protein